MASSVTNSMTGIKKEVETACKRVLIVFIILLIVSFEKSETSASGESDSIVVGEGYRKCCYSGSALTMNGESYYCVENYSSTFQEYEIAHRAEFFESKTRIRGNDEIRESFFPVCKNGANLTSVPLADIEPKNFPRDSCTDILYSFNKNLEDEDENDDGSAAAAESKPFAALPHVLFCSDSNSKNDTSLTDLDAPKILKIRRCCTRGETFQMNSRACLIPDNPSEDISTRNLVSNYIASTDFVYASRGPPKCQNAIVDYQVNATDVSVADDRIKVTVPNSNDVVDLIANEESACIDVGNSPGLVVVRACESADYCRVNTCLRKCCLEDEAMVNTTCQKLPPHLTMAKWHSEVWNMPKKMGNTTKQIMNTTEYGLLVGKPCLYGMYAVLPDENWHIVPEGMIHVPEYKTYQHHEHCTDMFYNTMTGPDGFYPFVCFDDPPPEEIPIRARFTVNATLVIVSSAFLFTTLCVYVCLPTLQNLHGKTLMSHVGSLFMAYVCLALVAVATPPLEKRQYENPEVDPDSSPFCTFLGYSMLFFFLSTFFWLNVMCFDIWWKFGSLSHSGRTNTKRRDDFKRFVTYSIYAWGLALVFAIAAVIADTLESLPDYIRPGMGSNRCWFKGGPRLYGQLIFFTGPVLIQLLVNLVFFILTARKCNMVKAEIQKRVMVNRSDSRSRRFEADKSKLILNGKLFVVMGVTWLLEVISYFLDQYGEGLQWKAEFFYVSDVVNCLQGLLIFILFVLKKKVFQALRRKFGKGGKRRGSTATGGILDPYRVRKSPSSSTILSTFAVSSSP